jgi:hypothetical protein
MNTTIATATPAAEPEQPTAPRRHPGVRLAALLVGVGIVLALAGRLHVAVTVGLLMLAGIVWLLDSAVHDHRTGRRPLDEAGLPPAGPFSGSARRGSAPPSRTVSGS